MKMMEYEPIDCQCLSSGYKYHSILMLMSLIHVTNTSMESI